MNIVFMFPYRGIGGVSLLFLRLANLIKDRVNVFIVDYDDGYMAKHLPEGVAFMPLGNVSKLPGDCTIVFQSSAAWRIESFEKLPVSAKVFFWNLHPQNVSGDLITNTRSSKIRKLANSFSVFRRSKLRRFIHDLHQYDSLCFMDSENISATSKSLHLKEDFRLLPILTDGAPFEKNATKTSDHEGMLWLGRVEEFKVEPLIYLLRELDRVSEKNTVFRIIGEGRGLNVIKNDLVNGFINLKIVFLGELSGQTLVSEIKKSTLCFGMGTSALDMAKYYMPVVCMDYSYDEIKCPVTYKFLYEVSGYSLGRELPVYKEGGLSNIESILQDVVMSRCDVATRCYDYWARNHSPDAVFEIINAIKGARYTVGEITANRYDRADIFTRVLNLVLKFLPRRNSNTDVYKI